jgi:hypothetical protein
VLTYFYDFLLCCHGVFPFCPAIVSAGGAVPADALLGVSAHILAIPVSAEAAVLCQQIVDVLSIQAAVQHPLEVAVADCNSVLGGGANDDVVFFYHVPGVNDVSQGSHIKRSFVFLFRCESIINDFLSAVKDFLKYFSFIFQNFS